MAVRADEAKVGLSCVASTFFQRVHVMNVQKRTRLNSGFAYFGFRVELAIVAKELTRSCAAADEAVREPGGPDAHLGLLLLGHAFKGSSGKIVVDQFDGLGVDLALLGHPGFIFDADPRIDGMPGLDLQLGDLDSFIVVEGSQRA
jgi:hypothetical protein